MITITKLNSFLIEYFQTKGIKDYCPTGLQVTGQEKISKIALGVSANLEFFKKAIKNNCQTCIVHHGLFWQKDWPFVIDEIWKNRLQYLFEHRLSLFAYHYPLDSHPKIGNNSQILQKLGCKITQPFGRDEHFTWGYQGSFFKAITFNDLVNKTKKNFTFTVGTRQCLVPTQNQMIRNTNSNYIIFPFGKKTIKTIGVVSGGGSFALREAINKNLDVFLTGSLKEPDQEIAREGKINVIAPGHYITEQFGIKALGKVLEKEFKIETIFLDIPNRL